jgi:hypothetical protein
MRQDEARFILREQRAAARTQIRESRKKIIKLQKEAREIARSENRRMQRADEEDPYLSDEQRQARTQKIKADSAIVAKKAAQQRRAYFAQLRGVFQNAGQPIPQLLAENDA